jgi:hypothetical protein
VPAPTPAEALLQGHFERLSGLIAKAERVAEALLDCLLNKVQRRETVYPGELVHICRGLHALARCGAELGRMLKLAGRSAAPTRGITAADIDQLAARLRPLLERKAA